MNLRHNIKKGNKASVQEHTKAMIFLCYHIHEGLKIKYHTMKDSYELRKNLNERSDHQKIVILLKAWYDWINLHLQDYKTVEE